jgi:hypothetical protein
VASTPGEEGKWFVAAREAGLYDEAIALAKRSPCDPRTLTRAARDFADTKPTFATEIGLAALAWLADGYGYEITAADVAAAHNATVKAARNTGGLDEIRGRIGALVADGRPRSDFIARVLSRELLTRR